MPREKIGPDQIINLIWIASIVVMIAVLYFKKAPYIEVTGGSIVELIRNGKIERDGVTIAWHGDTLCNPEELRVAARMLTHMADSAEKGKP